MGYLAAVLQGGVPDSLRAPPGACRVEGAVSKLTDLSVRRAAPRGRPYKLADGGGLFLLVRADGARYWRFNYKLGGKYRTAALGVYMGKGATRVGVSLAEARRRAAAMRALLSDGIDPAEHQRAQAARVELEALDLAGQVRQQRRARQQQREDRQAAHKAARHTVEVVAGMWVDDRRPHWSDGTVRQVEQSLRDHVYPKIGTRPIAEVTTAEALEPLTELLKAGKAETARRVRQRLSSIWRFAVLRGLAPHDVVAVAADEFKERRRLALKANPRRNFAAVPLAELPALLRSISAYHGTEQVRLGLRLLLLTLVRTSELRLAQWSEFELAGTAPTWTIPVKRMKVKTRGDRAAGPHVVPLSRQAVQALQSLRALELDPVWVLPGIGRRRGDGVLSGNAMLYALYGMGYKERQTGHGFRAVGSTFLHEHGFSRDLVEAQLAHEDASDVAWRYNRAEYLSRRRDMLQWYADALDRLEAGATDQVVSLHTV